MIDINDIDINATDINATDTEINATNTDTDINETDRLQTPTTVDGYRRDVTNRQLQYKMAMKRKLGEHVSRHVDDILGDEPWAASYADSRRRKGHLTHAMLVNDVLSSKKSTLNWCYDQGLLCSAPSCPKCSYLMTMNKDISAHASSQGLVWSCRRQTEGNHCVYWCNRTMFPSRLWRRRWTCHYLAHLPTRRTS
jgi:hypothetical protein